MLAVLLMYILQNTHQSSRTRASTNRKTKIATRKNEIVNRLEKTKKWMDTDLQAELIERQRIEKAEKAREVACVCVCVCVCTRVRACVCDGGASLWVWLWVLVLVR
jgi:Flp pilus assembly protein TadB